MSRFVKSIVLLGATGVAAGLVEERSRYDRIEAAIERAQVQLVGPRGSQPPRFPVSEAKEVPASTAEFESPGAIVERSDVTSYGKARTTLMWNLESEPQRRVTLLTGVHGVGKTSLVRSVCPSRNLLYVPISEGPVAQQLDDALFLLPWWIRASYDMQEALHRLANTDPSALRRTMLRQCLSSLQQHLVVRLERGVHHAPVVVFDSVDDVLGEPNTRTTLLRWADDVAKRGVASPWLVSGRHDASRLVRATVHEHRVVSLDDATDEEAMAYVETLLSKHVSLRGLKDLKNLCVRLVGGRIQDLQLAANLVLELTPPDELVTILLQQPLRTLWHGANTAQRDSVNMGVPWLGTLMSAVVQAMVEFHGVLPESVFHSLVQQLQKDAPGGEPSQPVVATDLLDHMVACGWVHVLEYNSPRTEELLMAQEFSSRHLSQAVIVPTSARMLNAMSMVQADRMWLDKLVPGRDGDGDEDVDRP